MWIIAILLSIHWFGIIPTIIWVGILTVLVKTGNMEEWRT